MGGSGRASHDAHISKSRYGAPALFFKDRDDLGVLLMPQVSRLRCVESLQFDLGVGVDAVDFKSS